MKPIETHKKRNAWFTLIMSIVIFGLFALVIGPWLEQRIPVFNQMVTLVEERDIDSGAYFYTEVEASYTGEAELAGGMQLKRPDLYGPTLPFISGLIICFLILIIGFKTLPD